MSQIFSASARLLAQVIANSRFGFKAKDESDAEGQRAADRLNFMLAEATLNPRTNRNSKQGRIQGFSGTSQDIQRILDDPKRPIGQRLTGRLSGDVSTGRGRINLNPLSAEEFGSIVGEGITLQHISRAAANSLRGNTDEQRNQSGRQRGNILAGRSLADLNKDFTPKPKPLPSLPDIDVFGDANLDLIKQIGKTDAFQFLVDNPDFSDREVEDAVKRRQDLFGRLRGFAKQSQFAGDPREREQGKKATKALEDFFGEIGFGSEASTEVGFGVGRLSNEPVRARANVADAGQDDPQESLVVNSTRELQLLLNSGEIDSATFKSAKDRLLAGAKGVNVRGFTTGNAQVGSIGNPNEQGVGGIGDTTKVFRRGSRTFGSGALQEQGAAGFGFDRARNAFTAGADVGAGSPTPSGAPQNAPQTSSPDQVDRGGLGSQINPPQGFHMDENGRTVPDSFDLLGGKALPDTNLDGTQGDIASLLATSKAVSPDIAAAYLPSILQKQTRLEGLRGRRTELFQTLVPTDVELTGEESLLDIQQLIDADIEGRAERDILKEEAAQKEANRINEENKRLRVEAAQLNRDLLIDEKETTELLNGLAIRNQIRKNLQEEVSVRRGLKKYGISVGTQGLKKMSDELQRGEDTLQTLIGVSKLDMRRLNRQIGRGYIIDIDRIINDFESQRATIKGTADSNISAIRERRDLSKSSKRDKIRGIIEKEETEKSTLEDAISLEIKNARLKMIDESRKEEDSKEKEFNTAYTQLMTLKEKLGVFDPEVASFLRDKLEGVDIDKIAAAKTRKEIEDENKRAMNAATDPSSFSDTESFNLQNMANNLSLTAFGSVDAQKTFRSGITSKLRRGDTEGARRDIMLQASETLKGKDGTDFQERANTAVTARNVLASLAAIGEENYVGFGPIDAAKQKALTAFGKGDPTYIAIAAQIGTINSQLINQLSGAAVSVEEYNRMKTFLPLLSEGGEAVKIKLNNLARYAEYVNEARVARRLGLPVPNDPTLSKAEQKSRDSMPKQQFVPEEYNYDGLDDVEEVSDLSPNQILSMTGQITQRFDTKVNYTSTGTHGGLDIAAPLGTGMLNLVEGKATVKEEDGGLGLHVIVKRPNGDLITYAHLSKTDVKDGDVLSKADLVGKIGHSGFTSRDLKRGLNGDHVHISVKVKGKFVDPEQYFSQLS